MKAQSSKARIRRRVPALCFAVLLCLAGCGQRAAEPEAAPAPTLTVTAPPPTEAPAAPSLVPEPLPTESGYDPAEMTGRVALLRLLKSQLGSDGQILDGDTPTGVYYTQWYVGGAYANGWNEGTPWCGAFVSWAVVQTAAQTGSVGAFTPFASMADGLQSFQEGENGQWLAAGETPLPGDLVFFDRDMSCEPDHVGVVTRAEEGRLYTIEGNSDDRVEACEYLRGDARILGFGVLNWGLGA